MFYFAQRECAFFRLRLENLFGLCGLLRLKFGHQCRRSSHLIDDLWVLPRAVSVFAIKPY